MAKGRRPKAKGIPKVVSTLPPSKPLPPTWLDDGARIEWDRVSEILYDRQILTDADVAALAMYCQTYSQYVDCQRQLNEDGLRIDSRLHPLARHADTLGKQLRGLIADFGFTPSARGRLEVEEEREDELLAFVANG